ncbi:cell cycle progression protein 1 [Petromyzon marinus]|uniref:cell cycle progression protein 1 n=1 Tax=Petromyzon marinus TaxID=7757 RepID=UPI003F722E6F
MSGVLSGDPEGLSSWTVIDPKEAAAVQTPQDDNDVVTNESEPVAMTENLQAATTPPMQEFERPKENEGILLATVSQAESFVTEEQEQLTPSYAKEETQEGELGGGGGGGGGSGVGGNSGDEDSDIVTLDPDVVEEVGPELLVHSRSAEAAPSHEFMRITPLPDTAKVCQPSSSDESNSPEAPATLRHRRPSKRKSPRGEHHVSAHPAAQTSISLHGCIICVACVVIALAALRKFMAGDPQGGITSPDLKEAAGDLNPLDVAAPALPDSMIQDIASLAEEKGDEGTSLSNRGQIRQMDNVATSDTVAASDNVAASDWIEEQKPVDLKELLTELQRLSNKVDNLKMTEVEAPVMTGEGDGGIVESDVELKHSIQAELAALANRLSRRFGERGSKQDETAQQSKLFHSEESFLDELKDSQYKTTIITPLEDVKKFKQESNELDTESKTNPPSESTGSGIIVEPIVKEDETVGKEGPHREVPREKRQEPKSSKKHIPKKPKHKSGQRWGTFEKMKTSAKAFFQKQKEKLKHAKKAIGDKFQKISDSFKSTFKRWKEKSKNFFEQKRGQENKARSHKYTATMNEPSNVKQHNDINKHKNERTAQDAKNDASQRPTVVRHSGSPGSKRGKGEAQKTSNNRKTSGADAAGKPQDIVSAPEMLQILRRYLEQIGNFRHWNELESFLNQFYRDGKLLRNQMSFEELVEAVQVYLEVLGYGKKMRAFGNNLHDYIKRRAPMGHKGPPHAASSQ